MKRIICLLLICLLLGACSKEANTPADTTPTEPPYEAQQPTLSPTEPEDPEQILAYRRDVVEAEMRRCMSTLWTPAEDITYLVKETDEEPITMVAGRIYQGLPYTHASASAYSFFTYASSQDEDGVYTISDLTGTSLAGGLLARQGCDCADTVLWAWGKVSNSFTSRYTAELTEAYGIVKVGDYTCDIPKFSTTTKPICKENGEDVMFAAYAEMQKGDALVLYTKASGGHAVMVVDTLIKYTEDGKIDGDNSYAIIIEQQPASQRELASYYNEEIQKTVYICGAVDSYWTFNTLFSKGYMPVTCKELVDPSPLDEESVSFSHTDATMDTLHQTSVNASHRIAYVTITISKNDQVVQQATAYGKESSYRQFSMYAFFDPLEQEVMHGMLDLDSLKSGNYHCTISCRLATGNTHTVHEFDFKK